MNSSIDAVRRERSDAVLSLAAARLDDEQRALFEAFARACLHYLDEDDLALRSNEDLLGALLSHWQCGGERAPGKARLRVISPTLAEHGWASRHSVIEIVNDDMPFLVDSVTMELNRAGLSVHLIVHPVLLARRDEHGRLRSLREVGAPGHDAQGTRESWMHIEVDRVVDAAQRAQLAQGIERVLGDVRAAVGDWKPMLQRLHEAIAELQSAPPTVPPELAAECRAFLQWLADDHITLLGYRRHDLAVEQDVDVLRLVPGSGLGVLRDAAQQRSSSFAALPAQARALARAPTPPLLITRSNTRSTVHRPGYTDYVGVKRYDAAGEVVGEHRFVGLFTSTAYSARVDEVPLLRHKVAAVARRAALPEGGHLAKALHHILATYPRDDLFQIGEDELFDAAQGILAAGERQRLRLFVWRDPYERFVSCLVYVPRDAYSTDLRKKFQSILMSAFAGQRADFGVLLGDTLLARVNFNIRTTPGQVGAADVRQVEAALAAAARRWDDDLRDALVDEHSPENTSCQMCTLYARGASSYAFCLVLRDWVGARSECALRGGDLLVVDDAGANDAIAGQVVTIQDSLGQWFFALNDRASEGGFVWLDGLPLLYTRWAMGEPNDTNNNEDCAVFYDLGDWNDQSCAALRPFVCEAPAP